MTSRFVLKTALQQEIEREAEDILEAARGEGERLLEDARNRREEILRDAKIKLERELEIRRRRVLSRSRLVGRNTLLEVKRREVDRVFEEVRRKLLAMAEEDPEEYGTILSALFRAARETLPEGPLRVRSGKTEKDLIGQAVGGKDVEFVVEEGLAGMILETGDGRVRCDDSLDALLHRIRSEREAEIERILFEDADETGPG
jgi:vacuolar-type H+-ATPase subunit E/Vma4